MDTGMRRVELTSPEWQWGVRSDDFNYGGIPAGPGEEDPAIRWFPTESYARESYVGYQLLPVSLVRRRTGQVEIVVERVDGVDRQTPTLTTMLDNRTATFTVASRACEHDEPDSDDDSGPPLVLVACALLWIGMAADRYLPQPWLNIAMTAIAATAIAAKIHRWRRRNG